MESLSPIEATLPPEEREALEGLFRAVRDRTGIDLTAYRSSTVLRRLSSRMHKLGCDCYSQYYRWLLDDPDECVRLISCLTIKVSRFFRNAAVFERLEQEVLPELLKGKAGNDPLRFWSAGCAKGEEAYSLVMVSHQLSITQRDPVRTLVYGTDVDEEALAAARVAVYREDALVEVQPQLVASYFSSRQGRFAPEYLLLPAWRDRVIFLRHDLLTAECAPDEQQFDLILCRNVLIYLERWAQEKVLALLRDSLVLGGYLVLGEAEQLPRSLLKDFQTIDRRAGLYRRIGGIPGLGRQIC